MNSMVQYSDTDVQQAMLISKLSGRPARVLNDVFVWNGLLVDRASAIVALLKIYAQVPVSSVAKNKLQSQYIKRFASEQSFRIINESINDTEIWFYKLCKQVQGEIKTRSADEIKEILIELHST